MSWSIRLARIAGTEVRLHLTFLLFLVWIGVAYFLLGGWEAAFFGVVFVSLLFLCVLLHEFGHVLAARWFGIPTPDITLLPIGGVARLQHMPERPLQELVIALAGPAVNIVIAAVLWPIAGGFVNPFDPDLIANPGAAMMGRLATINLLLAAFNMIPAFPMDGGRVFRALLGLALPYGTASLIAARAGQVLAILLGFVGLLINPFLILIAFFVFLGAQQEASLAQIREIGRGVAVAEAMMTDLHRLSVDADLDDAVEALLRTSQHEFPVVDAGEGLLGVVTRNDIIQALRAGNPRAGVTEFMQRDLPSVYAGDPFEVAFREMQKRSIPVVPVHDGAGHFLGLITPENVGELMMVRSIRPQNGRPSWRGGPGAAV